MEQIKLYSAKDLSEMLYMTKQGVNKAEREGRIENQPLLLVTPKGGRKNKSKE